VLRLPGNGIHPDPESVAGSYRRLADIFHDVLAEESLDALLRRIADTLAELTAYDALTVYWADDAKGELVPILARDPWAEEILRCTFPLDTGVTGWALARRTPARVTRLHEDPRAAQIPGTPAGEPEALVTIPLVARGRVKGALNVYRLGEHADFSDAEFDLLTRFGDAAALALDNAEIRLRLEHQAQTDPLTGLYNRRVFHERLQHDLARCVPAGEPLAVLMLDLDDFKRVNDVHGHAAGDHALTRLASLLQQAVRGTDTICRLGGEEFAVVLPGADAAAASQIAERLAAGIGSASFGVAGRITASIGVAYAPAHATNARELATCAEAAMMTAKAQGKDQVVVFEDERRARPDASDGRDARSLAHLKLLQSLVGRLNRLNRVDEVGAAIVDELRTLVDYHDCRVYVRRGDDLHPVAFRGDLGPRAQDAVEALSCTVGQGVTGTAAALGRSLLVENALECEFAVQIPGTDAVEESIVATPLTYAERTIGVIVLSKLGVGQFDEHDVRLLEVLAGHASVAIENARLYEAARSDAERARTEAERLERTLLATLEAIASAVEARGGHASDHPRRLAGLAVAVGRRLGLDEDARRRLELAGLLHDVGTIGFPAEILLKEGPLTDEERSILVLHPELGERILASVEELGDVRTIVRHCHERFDGAGYPDGTAGDAIPLESRIVHACDAYLAMTSVRPFRDALADSQARAELAAGAGTQFDPRVAEALLAVLPPA
jgi:diguanylate cyclase (GGDEF)-like protein